MKNLMPLGTLIYITTYPAINCTDKETTFITYRVVDHVKVFPNNMIEKLEPIAIEKKLLPYPIEVMVTKMITIGWAYPGEQKEAK